MEITVYAKKRSTNEGKTFFTYLSTLTKKDGTEQVTQVRFRDECGQPNPARCPMNIIIEKGNANMTTRTYTADDGTVGTSYTMWVSNWSEGAPFVDHSMDDYM